MKKRVYIETTIPSFYFTDRIDPESVARSIWTRKWWVEYATNFELISSPAVIAELRRGSKPIVKDRVDLIHTTELLEITDEIDEIASIYISRRVMPRDPAGDAMHVAVASFYHVDILLTWNCLHLANPNKLDHLRLINYELGLPMPIITTPLNFFGGDESNEPD